MEPWITVIVSFVSALIVAFIANRTTLRVAKINADTITRQQVLLCAVNTAITEYRAVTDAFIQGKSKLIPSPLDMHICHHIVFHFTLNGLTSPSVEELNEFLKHTRSVSRQVFDANSKAFTGCDERE
ncbi:MAG: hypothetical protein RRY29_08850 [Desulfovibrionaceae bacterium]